MGNLASLENEAAGAALAAHRLFYSANFAGSTSTCRSGLMAVGLLKRLPPPHSLPSSCSAGEFPRASRRFLLRDDPVGNGSTVDRLGATLRPVSSCISAAAAKNGFNRNSIRLTPIPIASRVIRESANTIAPPHPICIDRRPNIHAATPNSPPGDWSALSATRNNTPKAKTTISNIHSENIVVVQPVG
jgi:hypothetical protein